MNWGNKIVVAFVLFMAFILYMVVVAFQQHSDLVAEDYYAQEINYQQKIDQKKNLNQLKEKIQVIQEDQSIHLTFPEGQNPEGEIHFYHPSRKIFDKKVPIAMSSNNMQSINKSSLIPGNYRVNITWSSDGVDYYQQERITLK